MLSLEEKNELLERVGALQVQRGYNQIIDLLAPVPRSDLIREPELGYSLANAWNHKGEYWSALEVVRTLLSVCRAAGNDGLYRRCLLLEGAIYVEMGSLQSAESNFRCILPAATSMGDYNTLAAATMNLGVVFAIRCEWYQSLSALYSAMTAFQRLGKELGVADCNHNIGVAYTELGEFDTAREYFEDARRVFNSCGLSHLVGLVDVQRALLFSACGDLSLASATLDRAMEMVREYGDSRGVEQAEYARGKLLIARGHFVEAREVVTNLLIRAEVTESRLLQAEVREVLAQLEWHMGEIAEAVKNWIAAEELYTLIGSAARAAHARKQRDNCAAGGKV